MDIKDKSVIVTGASRGIGKTIALELAKKGANLALIARTSEDLQATSRECEAYGVRTELYAYDLTKVDEIPALVKRIKQDFKNVDALINDAGKYLAGDPYDANLADMDYVLDLNFRAVYHLTNLVLKLFPEDEAAVINISSISSLTITKGGEIYNSTKAALKSYGGCLFESVRERGIKVVTIYPGYVNTSMASASKLDQNKMIQPADVASAVIWALEMSGTACPTDITIRPQRSPSLE